MIKKSTVIATAVLMLAAVFQLSAAPDLPALEEKKAEALTKSVYPSVVKVEARDGRRKIATGVVMDNAGHIVTTALVSSQEEDISVLSSDGRWIKADFIGLDPETHIAVIRAREKNLTPVTLGSTSGLGPGAWIGIVSISPENTPAVTQGIVSSVSEEKLRLNVWVVPGSSGSPVVDTEGRMVGLLRGVFTDENPVVFEFREREVVGSGLVWSRAESPASGMALAVPVETVKSIFQEIKDKGKVLRGWMGVSIADIEDNQVVIAGVEKGSPAALAKLQEGDVAVKFNGKNVSSAPMLAAAVRRSKPGQEVALQVLRRGKTLDVKVKLGEYPAGEAHRELSIKFPELFTRPSPSDETKLRKMLTPERGLWERRKYIGVFLQETSADLAGFFGLSEGEGLLVNQLTKGGPAEKAGLRVGDLIFKVDGKRVETVAALSAVIQTRKKGDKVKIEFLRDKKPSSVQVEIAEEERGDPFNRLAWSYGQKSLKGSEEKLRKVFEKSRQDWEKAYLTFGSFYRI